MTANLGLADVVSTTDDWSLALEPQVRDAAWFHEVPRTTRSWFGQERVAHSLRVAIRFESGLIHGLLVVADDPAADPCLVRALRREIEEEATHSRAFEHLIAALDARTWEASGEVPAFRATPGGEAASVIRLACTRPELFWLLVLAGEEPVDWLQRLALRTAEPGYPAALTAVLEMHIRDEARHRHLAKGQLRQILPSLSPRRRAFFAQAAGPLVDRTARRIVGLPPDLLREVGVANPSDVAEGHVRAVLAPATRSIARLLAELDVPLCLPGLAVADIELPVPEPPTPPRTAPR